MRVSEAAKRLGISVDSVYKLVKAGKIQVTHPKNGLPRQTYDISDEAIARRLAYKREIEAARKRARALS